MEEIRKQTGDKKRFIAVAAAVAILFIAGIGSGIFFFAGRGISPSEKALMRENEKEYKKMQEEMVTEKGDDPMLREIDFKALREVNPDVYAWIWIPGTNIDYPILQSMTEPDEYYLNTTINGKTGYPGSIYTEKYNSKDFTDPITVIYGHEMRDGTMFTGLHSYTDQEFFEDYPYVYVYTPDRVLKYRIFAAVAFDDRYILYEYNYYNGEEFQRYVDDVRSSINGNVDWDVEVRQENTVLVLSTCINESPSQRWLVNATLEEWEVGQ